MNSRYYIMTDTVPHGPYTLAELRALKPDPEAEVWDETGSCRVKAAELMPPPGLHDGDDAAEGAPAEVPTEPLEPTAPAPPPAQVPEHQTTHFRISGYIRILLITLALVIAVIVVGTLIYAHFLLQK